MSTAVMHEKPQFLRIEAGSGHRGVDRANSRINGVIVAELGAFKTPLRGQFNDHSLNALVELGSGIGPSFRGVKSRLTHGMLSEDGIASNLGRVKNLRREDGKAVGDLFFTRASSKSPDGDLADFVMTFAEDDPEAFGMSVVIKTDMFNPETLEPVDDMEADELRSEGITPLWIPTSLHSIDVVDEGDATSKFLSSGQLLDAPVRQATQVLDRLFSSQPREVIRSRCEAYLDRYLNNKFGELEMPQESTLEVDQELRKEEEPKESETQVETDTVVQPGEPDPEPTPKLDSGNDRAVEIAQVCQLAGVPERTAEFIAKTELSAADIRTHLLESMTKERSLRATESSSSPESTDSFALWREDYEKQEKHFSRKGITLEKYIENRKRYDKVPA